MLPAIRVIVQARMGSRRYPGKSLATLCQQPVLAWVVRRLLAAGKGYAGPWQVAVATSDHEADDLITAWCATHEVPVVRGSQLDVLSRFLRATADLSDDAIFLRATADNPLYCLSRVSEIVAHHLAGGFDYTGVEGLSYAVPEVCRVGALRHMAARADLNAYCHEHVTPYFRWVPNPYRVCVLPPVWRGLRPDLRLTVDTPRDLARVEQVCRAAMAASAVPVGCDGLELDAVLHAAAIVARGPAAQFAS